MTTCLTGVCGTGGPIGPLPGDPNNTVNFTATAAYGGIDLNWSLPSVNPHAVAFVKIYRNTSNNPAGAIYRNSASGSFYYDKCDPGILYFYWIEITSINGTTNTWIGPASATAMSTIAKTIEDLTDKIDNGLLATSLKTKIGEITLLGNSITQEVQNRLAALQALTNSLNGLDAELTQAITIIDQEIQERIDADGATVTQMNLWAAGFEDAIAGITEEIIVQTGPNSALAQRITTAEATLNGDTATGQVGLTTWVNELDGKTTDIGARWTAILNVNGLVGGFGIYNNGTTVQAGFDVDEFWIGRTNANKRKPFIISNDVVYLNEAAIEKLTFNKLRDESGSFIVENGKVKADYLDTKGLIIRDAAGNPIFGAGTPLNISMITGLGSLATKNSVNAGSGEVSGLGSLAFANQVILNGGGSVKFQDGSTVGINDLVTRLSKIDGTNISTFIAGAAIGSAYIGNAAIGNAHIQNLAVGTLQLGNNAVSVSNVESYPGVTEGNGSNITVATVSITLDYPGTIFASCSGYISYGSGWRNVTTSLLINSTTVASGGGTEGWTNASMSGALENQPAGTYTVSLVFNGAGGSRIHNPTVFVQGTKK